MNKSNLTKQKHNKLVH